MVVLIVDESNPVFLPRRSDLWIARLYYFCWLGGAGFINPFLNLFYTRRGLSGVEIGWVAAVGALVATLAAPWWSGLIDRSAARSRRLLQISIVASGLIMVAVGEQVQFVWIALLSGLRMLFYAAISPLSDALVLRITGGTRAGYGSVRVWGSLGWALIVLVSGWLIERTGFMAGFIGIGATALASAILLAALSPELFVKPGAHPVRRDLLGAVRASLRNPALVGLALLVAVTGLANAGVLQFEPIYLSQLGADTALIGVAGMVSSVVELAGMLWADRVIRRYGPAVTLRVAMLIYAGLRAAVFIFPSIPTIIVTRAIGGLAFSLYTVALVRFIADQTVPEETATTLAVFTVTLVSLIGIVGNPLAGAFFDHLGARWLYPIAVLGYVAAWGIIRISRAGRVREEIVEIG
jgi:MFS transporter, PPP family, 3-phenylpropionic acid transporter